MPYRNVEQVARFTAEEIRNVSRAFRVESATPERIVLRIPPWEGEAWFEESPFCFTLPITTLLLLGLPFVEAAWPVLVSWFAVLVLFLAFRRFAYAQKRVTIFPNTNLVTVSSGSLAATRVASGVTKRRVFGFGLDVDGVRYALWRRWLPSRQATTASIEFLGRLLTADPERAAFSEAHIGPAHVPPGVIGLAPLDRAALAAVLRYFSFSSEKIAFRGPRELYILAQLVNVLAGAIGPLAAMGLPGETLTTPTGLALVVGCPILNLLNGIYWQLKASNLVLVVYAGASSIGVVRSGAETREPLESAPFSIQNSESGEVTHLAVELDACRGTIVVVGVVDEAVVERLRSFLKAFAAPRVASPNGLRS